ncbi:hypothetical protein ABT185_08375 [Streptomyces clavifer]|uniref:hypothetical protein n=1 Tax=Streptomyces clavifer TaxID=68188 RepID=UPI003333CF55
MARFVVITLGERGALSSFDGLRVTVPASPVADTLEAGDASTTGLLHHLAVLGYLGGQL